MTAPSHVCPEIGEWRAWLDRRERPVATDLSDHLATCVGCRAVVDELRDAANHADSALSMLPVASPTREDVAVARARLAGRGTVQRPIEAPVSRRRWQRVSTSWRVAGSGIAAAIALTLVVSLTPAGQAAAAGFLAQFRSQQVAALEVSPQTQAEIMKTLTTLGNLGTIQTPAGPLNPARPDASARAIAPSPQTVSLADATRTLGFPIQTPDPSTLPAGMDPTPTVRVTPASQVRFTFDRAKAQAYLQSTGHANVNLPDKFDGASLVVSIPPAAIVQYGGNSKDAVLIGQSGELVIDVEGKVSLDEMRDFLLGLPGLPTSTVNQLKQIKNWNQTLPIPVPVDMVNWHPTTVKGNQGLLLNDNSGVGSAAIWHENGHLVGVAGSLKANDTKRIADSLAPR